MVAHRFGAVGSDGTPASRIVIARLSFTVSGRKTGGWRLRLRRYGFRQGLSDSIAGRIGEVIVESLFHTFLLSLLNFHVHNCRYLDTTNQPNSFSFFYLQARTTDSLFNGLALTFCFAQFHHFHAPRAGAYENGAF
jgi:hypothetical protein